MLRTRTLLTGFFVVLTFLPLTPSQIAQAQGVPCNNSHAESVIPRNEKGQPLMPKEIQDDVKIMEKLREDRRLTVQDIRLCLKSNEPLTNHIIDFDLYVAAWMELKDPKPALLIQDSVLWSFNEGQVNLTTFTKKTKEANRKVTPAVTGKIEWNDVTLGPSFSAEGIEFPPKTSFNYSRFPNRADFSIATFGDHTSFDAATFGDRAYFGLARFGYNASFANATFGDHTSFGAARFGERASFVTARFGERASFVTARFGERASFARARFGDGASFVTARFGERASFGLARFGNHATFSKGNFDKNISFASTTFGGDISFRGATMKGKLKLFSTNWEGRADFRETEIQALCWDSTDSPSSVKGVFDAREAKFKKAVFKEIRFSDLVDFSDVEFGRFGKISSDNDKSKMDSCKREADEPPLKQSEQETEKFLFQNLIFEKEVDFLRAAFHNDAIFVWNRFHSVWDLTGVKLPKNEWPEDTKNPHLCLSFNLINKLFLQREHLGYESSWTENFVPNLLPLTALKKSRVRGVLGDAMYSCSNFLDKSRGENKSGKENEDLWEIYNTIGSSFREANDRLAENEAWYLSLVAEQESQYSDMKKWWLFILGDLPSRYGIDLYRVVLVSVVLMLVFAMIYWFYFLLLIHFYKWKLKVKLKPFPDQKRAFRFRPFERFFQTLEKQERPLHPWKDALSLSGRAFFKLGLGTVYPPTRMLVWIASVEWILGMYMLIHFLLAVKNTLPIAVPFLAVAG